MEDENLNNKLDSDSNDQFKKLNIGLTELSGMMDSALDSAYSSIDSAMDEKQSIKFKAFINKYVALSVEGKHKEAENLKKQFSEQF